MSLTRAATPQSSIWKRYNSQKYLRQTNDFKPFDVLEMNKSDLDRLIAASNELAAQERGEEAIALLTAALGVELEPTQSAVVYALRGYRMFCGNRLEDALSDFMSSLQRRPNAGTTRYYAGRALTALGRDSEALEQFEVCDKLQPGRVDTLLCMAYLRTRLGDLQRAKANAEQVLLLEPNNPVALVRLASVCSELGLPQDALNCLRKIAPANVGEFGADYPYNLGVCYEDIGDIAAAQAQYSMALRMDPNHEDALAGLKATGRGGKHRKVHQRPQKRSRKRSRNLQKN